ncbi:hypothetical protein K8R14_01120 [bacterium]|nr:hypothetical protein [bacterium]
MVELSYGIGKLKGEKIGEEHGRKPEKVGKLRRNKSKIVDLFTKQTGGIPEYVLTGYCLSR